MVTSAHTAVDDLRSEDRELQNKAFQYLIDATSQPVNWAYEVWDAMVALLKNKDNHRRAIASQVLSNLAKSDPDKRILRDFNELLEVTKDERFVTARHCLQSLWKIGVSGKDQQKVVVEALTRRFKECRSEKNCTLIRSDIVQGLRKIYDQAQDETVKRRAMELIESEEDPKYRKKYSGAWKTK